LDLGAGGRVDKDCLADARLSRVLAQVESSRRQSHVLCLSFRADGEVNVLGVDLGEDVARRSPRAGRVDLDDVRRDGGIDGVPVSSPD